MEFRSHSEWEMRNYRKLLLSMTEDARVILIKLADRLHNMRTLEHLPKENRLADRAGDQGLRPSGPPPWAQVKWELEDLAFKFIETDAYRTSRRRSSSAGRSGSGRSWRCSGCWRRLELTRFRGHLNTEVTAT